MVMGENLVDKFVPLALAQRQAGLRAVARWLGLPAPGLSEAERLAAVQARAVVPGACGPAMPAAPARGALVAVQPIGMVPVDGGYEAQHIGWAGRDAARARDAFDLMADQAQRAGGADPFTTRQKDAGRAYAALVERHAAAGLGARGLEAGRSGAAGAGDGIIDRIVDEGRRIAAFEAAASAAPGLAVRRARTPGRRSIPALELVRGVCLDGLGVDGVLRRFGWSTFGGNRDAARQVLADALDRMANHN